MKPLVVEFQAFGPYAGYEKVDFSQLAKQGLFLICGKTGTGKTTILDAMTFALYGKSSGHGRDDLMAMRCTKADFNTSTFVCFEFENNGETYRFRRSLDRKRTNLSVAYECSKLDKNNVWQPLQEKFTEKDINNKAKEIIGLDYDQFSQVIVLPQGKFEQLLTSDSEDKEKILTSIFGEEKWEAIAKNIFWEAENRKNQLKADKTKIVNSLADEGCDKLSELELKIEEKKLQLESMEQEYARSDYDKQIKAQQDMLVLAKRFADMHSTKAQITNLESRKTERESWEQQLKDATKAAKIKNVLEEEKKAKDDLVRRTKEEEDAWKLEETCKIKSENASKVLSEHIAKESEIEADKKCKIQYEEKRSYYEGLDSLNKEYQEKLKAEDEAKKQEEAVKKECDLLAGQVVSLQKEYESVRVEHDRTLKAYIAGIAGELAKNLIEGEACPVCGNTKHPKKAVISADSVSKKDIDAKKAEMEDVYNKMNQTIEANNAQLKLYEEKKKQTAQKHGEVVAVETRISTTKDGLVEGIETLAELETEIEKIEKLVSDYYAVKEKLETADKKEKELYTESKSKVESAAKEKGAALKASELAITECDKALEENDFETREAAMALLISDVQMKKLSESIANFDAELKAQREIHKKLQDELKGIEEPDDEKCKEIVKSLERVKEEFIKNSEVLKSEISRLTEKYDGLVKQDDGLDEKLREAEQDLKIAKSLRGDNGVGLKRYVLGIMFSSVVSAANKMLELVHGGRYHLFRTDEKGLNGANKKGLELKVKDSRSSEHDGRFVSTLSGGEKFLASLALSIGMSTVAQKGGVKIEALFIDEGFGSLDEDSIEDAMDILKSIQEANGIVGIISHVQILQDRISTKLTVEEKNNSSHIIQTIG